jgi:putative membrane protein
VKNGSVKGGINILGLVGLAAAALLLNRYGMADIAVGAAAVGWGLAAVVVLRVLPIGCDALGWHVLFTPGRRPPMGTTLWVRWVSESVNALMPVAQIGGEFVRAHLISRPAVVPHPVIAGSEAGATVIVDLTTGLVSTAVFSTTGLILLLGRDGAGGLQGGVWWALAGLGAMIAAFVLAQRSGLLTRAVHWMAGRFTGDKAASFAQGAEALDSHMARIWRDRPAVAVSTFWRTASWFTSVAEIWVTLEFLGTPIAIADAVMIEALTQAARSAAFAVPGGLGVQEGSLLLLGDLVGLAPQSALALALVKRVREILTGVPALALWWWVAAREPA